MTVKPPDEIRKELLRIRLDPMANALRRFGLSLRLFLANDLKLAELIAALVEDNNALDVMVHDMAPIGDHVLEELTRRLHSYVAAAISLVDHTRRHPGTTPEELKHKVRDEIKRRFGSNELIAFVKDLRHYAVHYELPPIVFQERTKQGAGFERRLLLRQKGLLESGYGWKPGARKVIESATDDIDLDDVRSDYTSQIVSFQHWLGEQLSDEAKALLERQNVLIHELRLASIPGYYSRIESLLALTGKGIGTGEDVLRVLLRPDQIREARLKGAKFQDLMTLVVVEYPSMPQSLQQKLSAVFASLDRL